jgi:hypothetical protein
MEMKTPCERARRAREKYKIGRLLDARPNDEDDESLSVWVFKMEYRGNEEVVRMMFF